MPEKNQVERAVLAALERDAAINLHRHPVRVEYDVTRRALILEGEVEDIVAKKRAYEHASRIDGVQGVMDRLRVVPSEPRGDGAVRVSVAAALLQEPALLNHALRAHNKGLVESLRAPPAADGVIEIAVQDGVVTLTGRVGSLSHRRLIGVLAWWAPGRRDVIVEIEVAPPEADNDGEIADALRLVLEKDPLVHADQIGVRVRDRAVTLAGVVATAEEKKMAELDAWYLLGVSQVINRIEVRG